MAQTGAEPCTTVVAEWASVPNRRAYHKPNEDFAIIDDRNGIFVIVDGVSRDMTESGYPDPSPALEMSKVFAHASHKALVASSGTGQDRLEAIRQAALEGNKCVRAYNSRAVWDFLPGTVGIVALIAAGVLYYGYVGDCSGRIIRGNAARLLTRKQTTLIQQHRGEFTSHEVRNVICNDNQHPYGYGVFTGDERVASFVEVGLEQLRKGDVVVLATDGMDALFHSTGFRFAAPLSASGLMQQALELEEAHPALPSDDKTVIVLTCL
jgi:serine/threonine protein phosphatase PrpC